VTSRIRRGGVAFAFVALIVPACSGASGEADVEVTLDEYSIALSTTEISAGELTFAASNAGASVHEFEIFSVPEGADPNSLLIDDNVADTDGAGLRIVDEVEEIAPSTSASLKVNLGPGSYALICNLPGHYGQGMHTAFTVA
jgi:uncharacterized cupredoxin-like copper-binding protein